jgi:hypothetical protein
MHALVYFDFDGVLHPWPCAANRMFDNACIARLTGAVAAYDVGLVITSAWRLEWPLDDIKTRLDTLARHVIGTTPEIDDPFARHVRYQEVMLHRARHALTSVPWIAIDDEAGRYPADLDNLLLTDARVGFSGKDAEALIGMLGRITLGQTRVRP